MGIVTGIDPRLLKNTSPTVGHVAAYPPFRAGTFDQVENLAHVAAAAQRITKAKVLRGAKPTIKKEQHTTSKTECSGCREPLRNQSHYFIYVKNDESFRIPLGSWTSSCRVCKACFSNIKPWFDYYDIRYKEVRQLKE